jgi:hypothetical protein
LLDYYELLLRCLETDIARAREDGTSIVVTLLSVREDRSSGAEPGPDGERRPLDVLRHVAKSVTRRSADRVFLMRNKSQVVVILPRTAGEGGAVFGERVAAELAKANLAKERFSVGVGSSIFPDDGDSAESLYSRAEAALRESALA